MRRVLIASIAVLVLGLAVGGSAEAKKCGTGCLSGKVKKLSAGLVKAEKTIASLTQTVAAQGQTITQQSQAIGQQGQAIGQQGQAIKQTESLLSCLFVAPITQYGDPEGDFGYAFDTGAESVERTALDVTADGDLVDAWFLIDGCSEPEVLSAEASGATAFGDSLRGPFLARPLLP